MARIVFRCTYNMRLHNYKVFLNINFKWKNTLIRPENW